MRFQHIKNVLVIIDDSVAVLLQLPLVVVKPLLPDGVVNILDFQLPFDHQSWSLEFLVDLSGVFVISFDIVNDLAVQDLHHMLLVEDSINVKELLR